MALTLKPFSELVAMTKEKIDEAMAPLRARAVKAKADMATTKLEEEMITLERKIFEACTEKELDFDKVITMIDKYELSERKLKQINSLVEKLFPPVA